NVIFIERFVAAENREILDLRLDHQHTVEGIFVEPAERARADRMLDDNRELQKTLFLDLTREAVNQHPRLELADVGFNRQLPSANPRNVNRSSGIFQAWPSTT